MPSSNIPCKFFVTSTCRNGTSCSFSHVSPEEYALIISAPASSSKSLKYPCRFFMKGSCLKGQSCNFSHDKSFVATPIIETTESEDNCSICIDKPQMYGLLLNCNHLFCLACVRKWRKVSCKEGTGPEIKTGHLCPMCRSVSPYVVPSIVGFPQGGPAKEKTIELYRQHLSSIPCKYFFKSPENQRFCPYGDDCLYSHPSGQNNKARYTFGESYLINLKLKRERRQRIRELTSIQIHQSLEEYLMGADLSTDDEIHGGDVNALHEAYLNQEHFELSNMNEPTHEDSESDSLRFDEHGLSYNGYGLDTYDDEEIYFEEARYRSNRERYSEPSNQRSLQEIINGANMLNFFTEQDDYSDFYEGEHFSSDQDDPEFYY